ncbi:hypothetical protein [Bacillus sp. B15-48]|uniref:hypothetical protein n=1 Tax=Bacillus sp. B15-48 TaxID=1548601 RepID=UPI00193ED2A4|nr:hypothetical protein [Bacillus sp. B15-48]MBM4762884.1 hypothetical protein [Bacillus sp. B15-48]
MKRPIYHALIIFLLLIAGCNQTFQGQRSEENTRESRINILENKPETEQPKEDLEPMEEENIQPKDEAHPPAYGVPQQEPAEQPEGNESSNTELETEQRESDFKLPFHDFKARWNAISNEQGANLEIGSLEKVNSEDGSYYRSFFNQSLELRVFVTNNYVEKLQLLNSSQTNLLAMLAGWSQIIYMFNLDAQPHQIEELFTELGIGPNLDLNEVEDQTIEHEGIRYTVKRVQPGYLFEASGE